MVPDCPSTLIPQASPSHVITVANLPAYITRSPGLKLGAAAAGAGDSLMPVSADKRSTTQLYGSPVRALATP